MFIIIRVYHFSWNDKHFNKQSVYHSHQLLFNHLEGNWRKKGSESSCGGIWRSCRRGERRVWLRPAETRRTCRKERTPPGANQRPALPTPPRNHTQTHTHSLTQKYHSSVKRSTILTSEPIDASITHTKNTRQSDPKRQTEHIYRLSICRYLTNTEAHITPRVRYKREKMSTSHTRPTLSYAPFTLFTLSASFLSILTHTPGS